MIDYPDWVVHIFRLLNESALRDWVVGSWYIWPTMETIHFVSLCGLLGALAVVDFRLMGVYRQLSTEVANRLVSVALVAFAVNLLTGIGFLAGNTWKYIGGNPAFELKMFLILLLGLNALVFHFKLRPIFDDHRVTSTSRVVGSVSLVLWCVVIVCGRMITFAADYGG